MSYSAVWSRPTLEAASCLRVAVAGTAVGATNYWCYYDQRLSLLVVHRFRSLIVKAVGRITPLGSVWKERKLYCDKAVDSDFIAIFSRSLVLTSFACILEVLCH